MKIYASYGKILGRIFWMNLLLCLVGVLFLIQEWPYGKVIFGIGWLVFILIFAIAPLLPNYRPKIQRVQITLYYWGISLLLLFGNRNLRLLPGGFSWVWLPVAMLLVAAMMYIYLLFTGQTNSKIPDKFSKLSSIELSDSDLNKYTGVYTNETLPLNITLAVLFGELTAQATNQQPFPLQAVGTNIFLFDKAAIAIEFNPLFSGFTLYQHGGEFLFMRV